MDQEFQTICDDDSIKEISSYLVRYLKMLKDGQLEQIRVELSQLPSCEMWIVPGRRINFVTKPEDESSSDEDDDSMAENGMITTENTTAPSTSGSTTQVEEEDVDPGWTVVETNKKRK